MKNSMKPKTKRVKPITISGITFTTTNEYFCKHRTGWYVYPKFWIFKREYLACEDCGKLIPQSRWKITL